MKNVDVMVMDERTFKSLEKIMDAASSDIVKGNSDLLPSFRAVDEWMRVQNGTPLSPYCYCGNRTAPASVVCKKHTEKAERQAEKFKKLGVKRG
jgi:hypothetical protein